MVLGIVGIIVIVVAVIILLWAVGVYNRFVNLKNGIESNLKQISVALKKRLDLIGQVMDSVKGQMKFEKGTLTEVTKMRAGVTSNMSAEKAKQVDAASNKFLSGLSVQVENYPNLKSNEQVAQLITSINGLEDEISRLRYVYNNTVQEFNTKTQTIPTNMIASIGGFSKTKYLEFDETDKELKQAPKIKLE